MAPDLRGHGLTTSGADADLSLDTLAGDVLELWGAMFGPPSARAEQHGGRPEAAGGSVGSAAEHSATEESTATVLVGHSMGGAVAVRAAALSAPGGAAAGEPQRER